MPVTAYGTWESPIKASDTIAGVVRFGDLALDGDTVYWVETRPDEGGRQVVVRCHPEGRRNDVTPPPHNARTRVHEYGGGSIAAGRGHLFFSEFTDQRLYRISDGDIEPVTGPPDVPAGVRYADGRVLSDGSLVCVRETHLADGEPVNDLVRVFPDGVTTVIAEGADFYASPRPSPDESRIVWLEWDHPDMPWDDTRLILAGLDGSDATVVAGGAEESILQPEWRADGTLFFSSDRRGWWNLYRSGGSGVVPVLEVDADIGAPSWTFGQSNFAFLSGDRVLVGLWDDAIHRLAVVEPDGIMTPLDDDLTSHEGIITDGAGTAWFIGTGPASLPAVYRLDVDTADRTVLAANPSPVPEGYVPEPRTISFPTGDAATAHAVYYPPGNADFTAPKTEKPPLIVQVHGGPTSHVFPRLAITYAFWTSRGFGVVDVNYRGSSGFGREYRNLLRDNWGIYDVKDCLAAARYLAEQGEVDGNRLIITGGSAGGYTTLAALAFGDAFGAGCSHFGVADIALLAEHTHKFESRYLDRLVGTDPEEMRRRSPLFSCDRIEAPVVLFQGTEDRVVPPEQAEQIAAALADNGVPHALIMYEGEDHGFRRAENIIHSLETELAFYGRVFDFEPADELPEVPLR